MAIVSEERGAANKTGQQAGGKKGSEKHGIPKLQHNIHSKGHLEEEEEEEEDARTIILAKATELAHSKG